MRHSNWIDDRVGGLLVDCDASSRKTARFRKVSAGAYASETQQIIMSAESSDVELAPSGFGLRVA